MIGVAKMLNCAPSAFAPASRRRAAVARMTEIESIGRVGDEAADQIRIAAITVAGKDQNVAADAFARAVAATALRH